MEKSKRKIPMEDSRKFLDMERTKNDFFKIICHELRTPVSAILGFSEILKEFPDGEGNESIIQNIYDASQKLKEYSDTALIITQIDPENISSNMRPTKLNDLVEYAIPDVLKDVEQKNIELVSNIECESGEIMIEPGVIKGVIQIFLANAIFYSPENSRVEISLNEHDEKIELVFSDEGSGFPVEQYDKIKEFLKSGSTMKRSDWPGLRFAIAKFIMDIHNAEIAISNRPEKGAEVRLIFHINIIERDAMNQILSQLN
nr:hypothetical protein [Bacteroidota bacterium]